MTKYVIMVKVEGVSYYWNIKKRTLVNNKKSATTWKKLETAEKNLLNMGENTAYISEL